MLKKLLIEQICNFNFLIFKYFDLFRDTKLVLPNSKNKALHSVGLHIKDAMHIVFIIVNLISSLTLHEQSMALVFSFIPSVQLDFQRVELFEYSIEIYF